MEQIFTSKRIGNNTWVIHEKNAPSDKGAVPAMYLLVGDTHALMIDAGYGRQNLREYAETLTNKPIRMVANTHGHHDHVGGNKYFNTAFMSKTAEKLMLKRYPEGSAPEFNVITISNGYKIELGNREIEVFELEGHSPGSVAFLDSKERFIFTGDNLGAWAEGEDFGSGTMLWYKNSESQPGLAVFMRNVANILSRRREYDQICWGHGGEKPLEAELIEYYMIAILRALDGDSQPATEQRYDLDGNPLIRDYEHKRVAAFREASLLYDDRYINAPADTEPLS